MTSPLRPTYRRFEAACERAKAENIRVVSQHTSYAVVRSGDRHYSTNGITCTCAAGLAGDHICKHRAALHLHNEAKTERTRRVSRVEVISTEGHYFSDRRQA